MVGMKEAPKEMKGTTGIERLSTRRAKNGKEALDAMEEFGRTGRKKE